MIRGIQHFVIFISQYLMYEYFFCLKLLCFMKSSSCIFSMVSYNGIVFHFPVARLLLKFWCSLMLVACLIVCCQRTKTGFHGRFEMSCNRQTVQLLVSIVLC